MPNLLPFTEQKIRSAVFAIYAGFTARTFRDWYV